MGFVPQFKIASDIAISLRRIEAARQAVQDRPITASVLATLCETARLFFTHYSTMIEGNRLTQEQVFDVIEKKQHFPGRDGDEKEVLGYYAALERAEQFVAARGTISELPIRTLHALVMAEGRKKVKPTRYRDGQNVIRDSRSRGIVYMPPEAKDVPALMKAMVAWIDGGGTVAMPASSGNRPLSVREYYAQRLNAYYEALTIGPSHNYYAGRTGGGSCGFAWTIEASAKDQVLCQFLMSGTMAPRPQLAHPFFWGE